MPRMRATTVGDSPCSSSVTARFRRLSNSEAVPSGLIPLFYEPESMKVSLEMLDAVTITFGTDRLSFIARKSP